MRKGDLTQHRRTCLKNTNDQHWRKEHDDSSSDEDEQRQMTVAGQPIEETDDFKYLGSIVDKDAGLTKEITARITKAARAFQRLQPCLWRRPEIRLKTKLRVFQASVLSVLLYGAETWALHAAEITRLRTFYLQCLRRILRVTAYINHITNEEVLRCTEMPKVEKLLQRTRLWWLGHLVRMRDDRTPRQMLFARARTQPSGLEKRWSDAVQKDLKDNPFSNGRWLTLAKNRPSWRNAIHR